MAVRWYEREEAIVDEVINVPVEDLGFVDEDEKGKTKVLEVIPIKDLSNDEMIKIQNDKILVDKPGDYTDPLSPKSQTLTALITYQRMYKGAGGNLPFGIKTFLNWGSARTGKLVTRMNEVLGADTKKSESSQSQSTDSSSETSSTTQT